MHCCRVHQIQTTLLISSENNYNHYPEVPEIHVLVIAPYYNCAQPSARNTTRSFGKKWEKNDCPPASYCTVIYIPVGFGPITSQQKPNYVSEIQQDPLWHIDYHTKTWSNLHPKSSNHIHSAIQLSLSRGWNSGASLPPRQFPRGGEPNAARRSAGTFEADIVEPTDLITWDSSWLNLMPDHWRSPMSTFSVQAMDFTFPNSETQ